MTCRQDNQINHSQNSWIRHVAFSQESSHTLFEVLKSFTGSGHSSRNRQIEICTWQVLNIFQFLCLVLLILSVLLSIINNHILLFDFRKFSLEIAQNFTWDLSDHLSMKLDSLKEMITQIIKWNG